MSENLSPRLNTELRKLLNEISEDDISMMEDSKSLDENASPTRNIGIRKSKSVRSFTIIKENESKDKSLHHPNKSLKINFFWNNKKIKTLIFNIF
jgi:hypothetical protein